MTPRALTFALALALTSGWLLAPAIAAAEPAPLDWDVPSGHFYTQAAGFPPGTSPMGYAITDEDGVLFWSEFRRLGGVARLGYPCSRRFVWGGFVTQLTQKAGLQWRPEAKRVYFVNVFDDLSLAGKDQWLQAVRSTPPPLPAGFDGDKPWTQVVDGRLALLRVRPALERRYRSAADPLSLYGLPQSPVTDQGNHYAIRLQRAVLQEWKVDVPWAMAGEVTVANGGDVGKEAGLFPAKAMRPEPPPGTWRPVPGVYRIGGQATWYGSAFDGRQMASGLSYDPTDPASAACNAYPLGARLRVTAEATGASVEVVVRDTGPFAYPRLVDLSPAAFRKLGYPEARGIVPVRVELLAVAGQ
jgi:hypothetical protein